MIKFIISIIYKMYHVFFTLAKIYLLHIWQLQIYKVAYYRMKVEGRLLL